MYQVNYEMLLGMLRILKLFHSIGLYESVCNYMTELTEDDYYELIQLGMENVAPIYTVDQVGMNGDEEPSIMDEEDDDYGGHYHTLQTFSSPEMQEYYRLCRIYEYARGIEPEDNKFVKAAESNYINCLRSVSGHFSADFDDDRRTTKLIIETCPENWGPETDLIYCIHDTLEFYRENLGELRLEILKGSAVFLPQLPAPKGDLQNGKINL